MMSRSIKRLVILALFATIALTIFVIEAQIPIPVPIPGVKLGLANVITLVVLVQFRLRDAAAVLLIRILLGSIFVGQTIAEKQVSLVYQCDGRRVPQYRADHRSNGNHADSPGSGLPAVSTGDRMHLRLVHRICCRADDTAFAGMHQKTMKATPHNLCVALPENKF